ncbi:MAG: hypothetical protein HQ518_01590 [Rhodopirellula sp.]|nr:hypothetical protein [Rhodopirellula sp.]
MSEYQYVVFQAVDGPLNDKQLGFAQQQSTRADVSRWTLSVEYHYSTFRGDVDGLLRRGYDVYLQHTNYGDREIRLRLPHGMPGAKRVWSKYVDGEQLNWKADSSGRGGILSLHPFHETGDLEEVWETQRYLDAAIQVRERLVNGDLRALYLLWLCAADDDDNDPAEMIEPPVPHGISDMVVHAGELLSFFGLDPLLLVAAGQEINAAPTNVSTDQRFARWVKALSHQRANDLLLQLLIGDAASVKASLLAEIRDSQTPDDWPTTDRQRSLAELIEQAEALRSDDNAKQARKAQAKAKREDAKAERQRADRMKAMVKDPNKWLRDAEQLVDARGTHNYKAAAEILYDLREAVGGDEGARITRRHAAHLAKTHPTLNHLKSSLRKRGLLE